MSTTRAATAPPVRLGYQPTLDGLRAVAVVAVLLYHDDAVALLPGGFLGVDVFFVLSGFLITSILLSASRAGGSTVSAEFWIRRARRLIPAFLVMVLLISAITLFSGDIVNVSELRSQGLASIFYVYNWYLLRASPMVLTMFSHTWSLSIEEQWYLVWPFLLAALLLLTRRRPRALLVAVLALVAASFARMVVVGESDLLRASVATDARAWELLIGGALAIVRANYGIVVTAPRLRRVALGTALAGLAFLVWAFFHVTERDPALDEWLRLVVVAAVLAVIVGGLQTGPTLLHRTLGWRPVVAIGLISYGLYLFHIPLYELISREHVHLHGAWLLALRLIGVVAFATASYRLVEMPIRRGARHRRATPALLAVAVVGVTVVFVFATLHPAPIAAERLAQRDFRGFRADTPTGAVRVLVAGGDTAAALIDGLTPPVRVAGIGGAVAATAGCGLLPGTPVATADGAPPACRPWADVFREGREGFQPEVAVLMASTPDLFDRRIDGRLVRAGSREMTTMLRHELDRARRVLTAGGARLLLVTLPCADPDPSFGAAWAAVRRDPVRVAWLNSVWRQFAAAHPADVRIADVGPVLCPGAGASSVARATELRPDGVTLSGPGIGAVWLWLAPQVTKMTRA